MLNRRRTAGGALFTRCVQGRQKRNAAPQARDPQTRQGGRGGKVKSRKQAIAIGLSEARKKGRKVPRKSKK
jgi:hypothetical protein